MTKLICPECWPADEHKPGCEYADGICYCRAPLDNHESWCGMYPMQLELEGDALEAENARLRARVEALREALAGLEVGSRTFGISNAGFTTDDNGHLQLVGWAECDYCSWESHQQGQTWPPIHDGDCPVTKARATLASMEEDHEQTV